MGLFDTIDVEKFVLDKYKIKCFCGKLFSDSFQTKDLNSSMEHFCLRFGYSGVKLFKLDEPDKKYWHEYTDEEIKEKNKTLTNSSSFYKLFILKKGDGYFTEEGWKVENRFQRDMGELPHQWVKMYNSCSVCKKWIDVNVKFTNGIVEDLEIEMKDL